MMVFYVQILTLFLFLSLPQAGVESNVIMHLAIFKVFPLDLIGLLEINKKVNPLFLFQSVF